MASTLFCSHCGQPVSPDAEFCSNCGATQRPASQAPIPAEQRGPTAGSYPQQSPVVAGYQQAQPFHGYGGFWIRLLAFIIDWVVLLILTWPLRLFLFGFMGGFHPRIIVPNHPGMNPALGFMVAGGAFLGILRLFVGWLYWAGMQSSSYQATLGKMALGMKVTDLAGNRISFARATGRYFAKILSSMILFIGYFMIGFTERKQGLHDMLAGTLVLKK